MREGDCATVADAQSVEKASVKGFNSRPDSGMVRLPVRRIKGAIKAESVRLPTRRVKLNM